MSQQTPNVLENQVPGWWHDLNQKYLEGQSHIFILHFNIGDYVNGTDELRDYLPLILGNRDCIAWFDRASGVTFPYKPKQMEEAYIKALGLDPKALAEREAIFGSKFPSEPSAAFSQFEQLLRVKGKNAKGSEKCCNSVIVLDYAELVAPNADVAQLSPEDRSVLTHLQKWARDPAIKENGHLVLLLVNNLADLNSALRSGASRICALQVPLPNFDARLHYIEQLVEAGKSPEGEPQLTMTLAPAEMARLTAGLGRIHIEDIAYAAIHRSVPICRELVKARKREIVQAEFGEFIELIDPELNFADVGGLEHVKEFFRRNIIEPFKDGRWERVPKGVLALGPPGTGKTIMAEALAAEAGINCCILNPAKIFGHFVGDSERNLEKALQCIQSMTPIIVFIDEIDQAFQRSSGEADGGVSARVFKRLMEFTSDPSHRGKIVFIAASNRPDLLDAALKRPGRFDKKIPFLPPLGNERREILTVMTRRFVPGMNGKTPRPEQWPEKFITATKGWTGAELEALMQKSGEILSDKRAKTLHAAVELALKVYRPTTQDINHHSLLAMDEVNDLDLLPQEYWPILEARIKERSQKEWTDEVKA